MGTVTLLLAIHNHQPQGNFEHVFAQAYADCYRPLLDAVQRHPGVRFTLHYSGPLIEWLEVHHGDYFDVLAELVETGQVELLGGGFYEPMLAVLPERDARGQLELLADFVEGRVGQRPRGMWLAERVWEPDLARVIAGAGYRYTIVDDGHFLAAGMRRPLTGYYITDKAGLTLCLLPIARELRYAIPFRPPEEVIATLRRFADQAGDGDALVTYGDDGEKLGFWPGTRDWVWRERWLDRFLELLEENGGWLRTATCGEALRHRAPAGRVYLPTASYDELGEWALPAAAQERYAALREAVAAQGHEEDWGPFVRGGIWQGFLAKYPESNFLHKRMCHVSERVARAGALLDDDSERESHSAYQTAQRELYRGQCNCAYWHGLFGGLYSAKLRAAMHTHLLRADVAAGRVLGLKQPGEMERVDLDGDLIDEVILTNQTIGATVAPARGGAVLCIDDRRRAFCITDVLTRRPEAYHATIRELGTALTAAPPGGVNPLGPSSGASAPACAPGVAPGDASAPACAPAATAGDAPRSIHELTTLKDPRLAEALIYDPHQRLAFVDQFFDATLPLADLARCQAEERGDFRDAAYDLLQSAGGRLLLSRVGCVRPAGVAPVEVTLSKALQLGEGALRVEYEVTPTSAALRGVLFASELSLALPCGAHPTGRLHVAAASGDSDDELSTPGLTREAYRIMLSDPHTATLVTILPTPACTVVRFPLETASQSESGFERTYQGTTFVLLWPCELDAGRALRLVVTVNVS